MRTRATTRPRGVVISSQSPSVNPQVAASTAAISTHMSGAAACNCGARPVFVRVWKW